MKTPEEVLTEWVSDSIKFAGGGKHNVYTREEFDLLVKAMQANDVGMLVKIEGNCPIVIPQSNTVGVNGTGVVLNGQTVTEKHYGRPANWCVDWKLAMHLHAHLNAVTCSGGRLLTARILAHFSSFEDAIKNLPDLKNGSTVCHCQKTT